MRSSAAYQAVVRDSYLDDPIGEAAERFARSPEFQSVQALVGISPNGRSVLDLGAGRGIASYAWARSGASLVYSLEPDPSDIVGVGAIRALTSQFSLPVQVVQSFGERIPLGDGTIDIVYGRQVLHHVGDVNQVLRECARVLKKGGRFVSCREHVVDNDEQLREFLARHPIHQLAGGENAHRLEQYVSAIEGAGLRMISCLGPWDTLLNAYPTALSENDLRFLPRKRLRERLGRLGTLASRIPGVTAYMWMRYNRPWPGRMYSFVAEKP